MRHNNHHRQNHHRVDDLYNSRYNVNNNDDDSKSFEGQSGEEADHLTNSSASISDNLSRTQRHKKNHHQHHKFNHSLVNGSIEERGRDLFDSEQF